MKKKYPKYLSFMMSLAFLVNPVCIAYASSSASVAEDITNNDVKGRDEILVQKSEYQQHSAKINDAGSDVYATQTAEYSITIPKTIILNGNATDSNSGEYTVSVTGNLTGTQEIQVVPMTNTTQVYGNGEAFDDTKVQFYLGQKGKSDIISTVTQTKTSWNWEDAVNADKSKATGVIVASGMSAGAWYGNLDFNVTIMDASTVKITHTIQYPQDMTGISVTAVDILGTRYSGIVLNSVVTFEGLTAGCEYTIEYEGDVDPAIAITSFKTDSKDAGALVDDVPEYTLPEEDSEYSILRSTASETSVSSVFLGGPYERRSIEKVTLESGILIPSDAISVWDVSEAQDGSIVAYATNVDNDKYYEVTICSDTNIYANPDSSNLFRYIGYEGDEPDVINNLSLLNTMKVTNMNDMFAYCGRKSMISLDLGDKFYTYNVTTMSAMFRNCGYNSMVSLDLGDDFYTNNVTNMYYMFASCGYSAMTSLDLGKWFYTNNVTNMNSMFYRCGYKQMTSLCIGNLNPNTTIKNTLYNYNYMFSSCGKPTIKITCYNLDGVEWLNQRVSRKITYIDKEQDSY